MTKASGSIAIHKGNRIGKPVALYVENGAGNLSRVDYRTAADARKAASDIARKTGWKVTEDLGRERDPHAQRAAQPTRR